MSARTIVVGGGIAGLVAARRLALQGADVLVLEAAEHVGGQLASHTVGGILLDAGADSFATRGGTVAALAGALGLGDDVVAPAAGPAWLHRADGSAVPLPATSLLGIPSVPLAADVVAAIGMRAALRAQLDALLIGQVGMNARTLGELVRKRMGRGVLEGLVAPVVRGVHSVAPDELDVDQAFPGLRAAFRSATNLQGAVRSLRAKAPAGSAVLGIRGGMHRLIEALLGELARFGVEVRTGARVGTADPAGVTLVGGERLDGPVVLAAPGIGEADPVPGRRVTLVTLVVDAPELDDAPRGTGVLVAEGADVGARALTHVTAKWEWVAAAADGRHVLRLSYDGEPGREGLVERARRDAIALLGREFPQPDDAAITTWERPATRAHSVDGMQRVGQSMSGTGVAAVVALADAVEAVETGSDAEPQG